MSVVIMSGRARQLKQDIMARVKRALGAGDSPVILIVPSQYTLQAELDILTGCDIAGSFRLQVLSPGRLNTRVFEQAGWPGGAKIDEQGRVMLVHEAARRLKKRLGWYQSSVSRKGFAEKALVQIIGFKQARLSPVDVLALAERQQNESIRRKLTDLAVLYQGYDEALSGRFLDGDDEMRQAAARMGDAAGLRGADVFVYGFDTLAQPFAESLVALSIIANSTLIGMTCDEDCRDADIFVPAARSLARLKKIAAAADVQVIELRAADDDGFSAPDIAHLARELYSAPMYVYDGVPSHMQLAAMKNPQDEAEFAAALARELVMSRGWRWRDVAVVCQSLDEVYLGALRRAFKLYDVPLFLPSSRPASRHPAAVCLTSAIRLINRGWRTDDFVLYIRSGFTGITANAADELINHALRRGLRGKALKTELRYLKGSQTHLEDTRAQVAAPLLELEARTHGERDSRRLLTSIFEFMDSLDMCGKIERMAESLISLGEREWAMEGAQVYARILASLDQMAELLKDAPLPLREFEQLIERALEVVEIKPLPQSGDAVLCGSVDHIKNGDMRALLIIGLTDASAPHDAGLLSEKEMRAIGNMELSPVMSPKDRLRAQRLSVKSALAFTGEYLYLSYPLSGAKGDALKPSVLIGQIRRIMPQLPMRGGIATDARMLEIRLNSRAAAESRLPALLADGRTNPYLISALMALGEPVPAGAPLDGGKLPAELAVALFGDLDSVSVTRLETYARCPYRHFATYALRPEEFHEFTLTPQDAGTFYHDAMEQFLTAHGERLAELSESDSMAKMDEVTSDMMEELARKSLGEGALAAAEGEELRQVARRAAATIVHQLSGSEFAPMALEVDFGQVEPKITLGGQAHLGGRIDRIDGWDTPGGRYLRVIDYKTGGKALSMAELYYGLQMQLMVYLAAAAQQHGGKPAGAFYFTLADKVVSSQSRDAAEIERERWKALKLKGVVVKDAEVQAAMSDHPEDVLPVRGDALVDEGDLRLLMKNTLERAERTLRALKSGAIEKLPSMMGDELACDYCPHTAICQRDQFAPVRELERLKGAEVLEMLRGHDGLPPD